MPPYDPRALGLRRAIGCAGRVPRTPPDRLRQSDLLEFVPRRDAELALAGSDRRALTRSWACGRLCFLSSPPCASMPASFARARPVLVRLGVSAPSTPPTLPSPSRGEGHSSAARFSLPP